MSPGYPTCSSLPHYVTATPHLPDQDQLPCQDGDPSPGLLVFWHEDPEVGVHILKFSRTLASPGGVFPFLGTRMSRTTEPRITEIEVQILQVNHHWK